jgi:ribulose bisphosphate carboxylase small subunit
MLKCRKLRVAGYVERKGKKRNTCSILVMKPEGRRALVKPRSRWKII